VREDKFSIRWIREERRTSSFSAVIISKPAILLTWGGGRGREGGREGGRMDR
jgi:hypothetical protein